MELLTVAQMRAAEQMGVQTGIKEEQMMEQAGKSAADALLSEYADYTRMVVLCGKGNNGGDGAVVARYWAKAGREVKVVYVLGEPVTECAKSMAEQLNHCAVSKVDYSQNRDLATEWLSDCDLVIDGVFGIGFHGDLPKQVQGVFSLCAEKGLPVVALDLPSGVSSDDGLVASGTPTCVATIAFHSYKFAHVLYPAATVCGKVTVADIGLSVNEQPSCFVIDQTEVAKQLVRSDGDTHKGTFGKATLLVGSKGMAGAATLAVQGCLRCGVGLCYPVVPESIYPMVSLAAPEGVYRVYDDTASPANVLPVCMDAPALLVGCGLGDRIFTRQMMYELIGSYDGCLVIDADGINSLVPHIHKLKERKAPTILTPHPGEMARLLGTTIQAVQSDRFNTAVAFAKTYGVVTVLKGAGTIVASPDGRVAVNRTGNSGLSKGGSGDLLAGMITSFCAQGIDPFEAAYTAVWLHGAAADKVARKFSKRGMLPSDVAEGLCELFLQFEA
ncbi:MAG: NAD(P)H-hydrate dehydratase [Clostridia bacterium]|nr:NAD(P)H-hydrate dehydratase [Clostridia bacterium]